MPQSTQEFNADELVAPSWLNNEFCEKVLKHCEQEQDLQLKNLEITPGSAKGDHYASIMFRVKADYRLRNEEKSRSMIIKAMPEHEGMKTDMLKELNIFESEIGMYSEVIPKFEAILQGAGDDTKLGANCLYHSLSPKKIIIFEDIVPLGYEVMRDREINLTEAKAVYSKIAKWHAISYKLNLEDPHFFDNYNKGFFLHTAIRNTEAFHDGIINFIELLDEHDDLKQYKPYFEPLVGKIVDECVKIFTEARKNPQADGLYVLCHGDFHLKNIMFQYDSKTRKFLDAMLLDFQMCYLGPIVNDILSSIYMLLDYDVRQNNLDEVLDFYFATFQETLRRIGFKGVIPDMAQFRKQLKRQKNYQLFLLVTFLPFKYLASDGEISGEEMMMNSQIRKSAFRDPRYLKDIRGMLTKLLQAGYLED